MLALIGLIFSSIFRGKGLDFLARISILEIIFVDWWLLPLLISKLN